MEDRRAGRESRAALSAAPGAPRPFRRSAAAALAACLAALLALAAAAAAGPIETIAGYEGDTHEQGYGFVTLGVLVPGGPGIEYPVRLTGSHLAYRYDSSGTEIRVRAPGASLLVGPRVTGPHGSFAVLAGAEVRRERREFDAAGLPARERTIGGFVAQAEADAEITRHWRAIALASWAGAAEYVYARGALRLQANNLDWQGPVVWFAGVEGVGQGNSDSGGWQAGAFGECALVREHVSLGLHAGYKESGSGAAKLTGAYVGTGVYRRF